MTGAEPQLALYVHWPWCLAKCPYCDFNSAATDPAAIPQAAYRDAILHELDHYASLTESRPLGSIFFGGGTPSLMSPDTVHTLIDAAQGHWGFRNDIEITIEANPTSVETAKFRAFREAGANRVSVGVQALNDQDLQTLGREHTAAEARDALDIAAAVFDRFTFDLIYARPGQGAGAWADELERALDLANDHVSLYQLTVEPGTAFFRAGVAEADEDLGADLFAITQDMTRDAGLPAYEISNHARPGAQSRHNLIYWQGGDYIGVGPGAHGRLSGIPARGGAARDTAATHQIADPARWLAQVNAHGHGTAKVRPLSGADRADELIMAGLRLTDGIARERFAALTGRDVTAFVDADALDMLCAAELMNLTDTHLTATDQGRLTLNAVLERLLA